MFRLVFLPEVSTDLKRLDKPTRLRIYRKINWLVEHASEVAHETLSGHLSGMNKLRVGDYRVVYDIDQTQKNLTVYAIGHRREVYKLD